MKNNKTTEPKAAIGRREFLKSAAAGATAMAATAGMGLALARAAGAQDAAPAVAPAAAPAPAPAGAPAAISPSTGDALNIALIGLGAQGRVLMDAILKIPDIRFRAVCDIWDYSQKYGSGLLKKYGHDVKVYTDYQEMLATEKDLDAVIVASPDWVHAEHAIASMNAGLHVYCEKEMSNSLVKAREMVLTARKTGKLLQIGHQRRSNPRYRFAIDRIVRENRLLGRVTQANAQWNRAKSDDLGWPKQYTLTQATLDKYGYETMERFRNWRWYRKYGGGPIVDLGSHQIDIFAWVFGSNPKSVMAGGGVDFYKQHEWYDNVMALYEYETPEGVSRAFYQVLTTTSNGGYYETFMGVDGTLLLSENPSKTKVLREAHAEEWDKHAKSGLLQKPVELALELPSGDSGAVIDVRESAALDSWALPVELNKPYHQPHLENFFDAIRNGTPLNCPAEIGYETAVAVLAVNEAVEKGKPIVFKPSDFVVA